MGSMNKEHEQHHNHHQQHDQADPQQSLLEYWEERYSESDQIWSGRVNQVLADVAGPLKQELTSRRALDLGCGEGGDALWLAQNGWETVGVDISSVATARGNAKAQEFGLPPEALRLEAGDLLVWDTADRFDLVTCSFLHSWPVPLAREEVLHRATRFVAPGGFLLITAHASHPEHPELKFPTPPEDLSALNLDPARWETLLCELRDRQGKMPDGSIATVTDSVVLVRFAGQN